MSHMQFELRLFGHFRLLDPAGTEIVIRSTKLRGLFALLALAPENRLTRATLQSILWGRSGATHGRATLRRELSNLREIMGDHFDMLFDASAEEVRLVQDAFKCTGTPEDGPFLANVTIQEPRFEKWLAERREQARDRRLKLPSNTIARLNPAICVAPFQTFSLDGGVSPMGDLLSLEITRSLTHCAFLDVISHLSSRRLDMVELDLCQTRQELNADYILFGTLKQAGDRLVISCDLVDLQSERHLWSETFVECAKDAYGADWAFPQMVAQLAMDSVMRHSMTAVNGGSAGPVHVHQRLMGAIGMMHQHHRAVVRQAQSELQSLLEECPERSVIYAWMAKVHVLWAHQGWSTDNEASAREALSLTESALRIDPSCSFSRAIHGQVVSNLSQDFEAGREHMDEALRRDPSNALAWLLKGALLSFSDGGAAAVHCTTKARNLSPMDPQKYYYDCIAATAHLTVDENEAALRLAKRSCEANPRHISSLRVRTIALEKLGLLEEAHESADELMRRDPDFTVDRYMRFHPAAKFSAGESWARSLAAAGVPQR